MDARRDIAVTLPWMRGGTELFARALERVSDDDLRGPSALPGWTRAHIVAHVARNAEALSRLAAWARTGVETPMYPSPEDRNADIERTAVAETDVLRREVAGTAVGLDTALAVLGESAWQAEVRTAQGRPIPAAEIPWMRVREVWLHAVDLDAGVAMDDLDPGVVDALLDDATGHLSNAADCPAVLIAPTDRERTWALVPGADEPVKLTGPAPGLLGWLLGRGGADGVASTGGAVPTPPRWL